MIPSIIGRKKSSVAGSGARDILIQICGFRFIAIFASAFLKPTAPEKFSCGAKKSWTVPVSRCYSTEPV
ncbi:hypothetical protein [Acidocella sp. MX-AZ02]|uniref:hypothetical protein n=1 Tax=Acidocella sp. MX-AZ02 TaxID=1214225 RepID=UPI0014396E80|nr:hypothetical protein [Acidocella sp. MX-AZ02]